MPTPAHPAPQSRDAARTSVALTRASSMTFTIILTIFFALAVSVLIYFARTQDHVGEAQTRSSIERSIGAAQNSLYLSLKDYAFWGDAYKNLHSTVDVSWAFERDNFGPSLFEDYGYQGLFILGPADQTLYSVVRGKRVPVSAADWLAQPLDQWAHTARERAADEDPVTILTTIHDVPALVGVAAITPGTDPTIAEDGQVASVMIIVKLLDPVALDEMGRNLGIKGLELAPDAEPTEPQVILQSTRDRGIVLQWQAVKPGRQMVDLVLPMIILGWLGLLLMTEVMQRRNRLVASRLDASHELLQSSQIALATSEARFRDVAEASSDWIWESDAQGRVSYLSDRFESVTGLAKAAWLGHPLDQLIEVQHGTLLGWLQRPEGEGSATLECRYRDARQGHRTARVAARNIGESGFRGTATDVTDEIQARQAVEFLSRHDVLTGLPNRNELRNFLEGKLLASAGPTPSLAVLTIDLDRFKPVNDLLGHATGDRVLHQVAKRIRQCVSDQDIAARVGGDEFVMILCAAVDSDEVASTCRRLIEMIEQAVVIDAQEIFLSASVGIAMAPTDACAATELLRYSDIALYEAKASGRGTWRFYTRDMSERIVDRRRLESDLRYAIDHDQLRLQYQPRVRMRDGHIVGAEALVRWHHPERGLLSPDVFVPIAEETGLIAALGDWVMLAACTQAKTWPTALFISINVSSKEFQSGQLVERVQAALSASGLPAARVELELTESVMLEDASRALSLMRALKLLGVRLSVDDFGTGYSSLSYLRSFPVDGLKIDRSFINRLGENPADLAIIEAVVALGRALSLTITAEGIETSEHMQLLKSVGCDEGQGYYLSRPVDAEVLGRLLRVGQLPIPVPVAQDRAAPAR